MGSSVVVVDGQYIYIFIIAIIILHYSFNQLRCAVVLLRFVHGWRLVTMNPIVSNNYTLNEGKYLQMHLPIAIVVAGVITLNHKLRDGTLIVIVD